MKYFLFDEHIGHSVDLLFNVYYLGEIHIAANI